jgi:hypothetical protein
MNKKNKIIEETRRPSRILLEKCDFNLHKFIEEVELFCQTLDKTYSIKKSRKSIRPEKAL